RREGLVAYDVDVTLEERRRDLVMQVVRCDDHDEVDAVVTPFCFGARHCTEVDVHTVGVEAQRTTVLARTRSIGRERAGDESRASLELGGTLVYGTDERTGPAAHHTEPQHPSHQSA